MKIFIITGQTATGKTELAFEYAKKYNGKIINCDSRQIYKYLNIVTGKDHFGKVLLYDIVDPHEYFSSFDYQQQALPLIKDLIKRGKTPIIVGGTYLYLYHLLYKIDTEDIPPNWKLRQELNTKTVLELQNRLRKLSPQSFNLPAGEAGRLNQSDRSNPQRLIRKIEILTANKLSPIGLNTPRRCNLAKKIKLKNIKIDFLGLKYQLKEDLITAIKKRVQKRIDQGAFEEVEKLLDKGYTENDPGLKTIGYRQIIQSLKGEITKDQAVNQWIIKETQYAKRQYSFMKRDQNINWQTI